MGDQRREGRPSGGSRNERPSSGGRGDRPGGGSRDDRRSGGSRDDRRSGGSRDGGRPERRTSDGGRDGAKRWDRDDRKTGDARRSDGPKRWDRDDKSTGGSRDGGRPERRSTDGGRDGAKRWDRDDRKTGDARRSDGPKRWDRDDRKTGDARRSDGPKRWDRDDRTTGDARRSDGAKRWDRDDKSTGSTRDGGRPERRTTDGGRDGAKRWDRDDRKTGDARRSDGPKRWDRDDRKPSGRPERRSDGGRDGAKRWDRDDRKSGDRSWSRKPLDEERSAEQATYDGPPIPEHITGKELDRNVAGQLKSLPEKLALRVARHLIAAGEALDDDPKTAYEHTLAARARAGRLAVVREAVGEAAYAAGEYSEALAELKSARRMNGSHDYLAVMADCERALGRPDRALTMLKNASRDKLAPELQAELIIVEAGARRDRGELDAAIRVLEQAPLNSRSRAEWVVRLRYAYADTLAAAGRSEESLEWFHRTAAIDADELTDAAERLG